MNDSTIRTTPGSQPDEFRFTLPPWLSPMASAYVTADTLDARMAFVIEAARRNVDEKTGGPFAAAVFERDTGTLIALGVNLVTTQGCSILHAEMVAIALAQKVLGTYDLGGAGLLAHELVTSTEPCAMCLGAIPWSGVRRVVCGARDGDARDAGFDEGTKPEGWRGALAARGIAVVADIQREAAAGVLSAYALGGGCLYNAGGADRA